jgi:hypothetical protein
MTAIFQVIYCTAESGLISIPPGMRVATPGTFAKYIQVSIFPSRS